MVLIMTEILGTDQRIEIQGDEAGILTEIGITGVDVILVVVTTIAVMTETVTTTNGGRMILAVVTILMVRDGMKIETGVKTDEMIIIVGAIIMRECHGRIIAARQMPPRR